MIHSRTESLCFLVYRLQLARQACRDSERTPEFYPSAFAPITSFQPFCQNTHSISAVLSSSMPSSIDLRATCARSTEKQCCLVYPLQVVCQDLRRHAQNQTNPKKYSAAFFPTHVLSSSYFWFSNSDPALTFSVTVRVESVYDSMQRTATSLLTVQAGPQVHRDHAPE